MTSVFWLQLLIVMICIGIGGRYGGVGLGAAGGVGVSVLVLIFGMKPSAPPTSVIFIIIAVISCVSVLQAAGGLDMLVKLAEKALRKKPSAITFLGPIICSIFSIFCGTTYVAFSVYPVVAEVAAEAKIRPERPLSMSVIAAGIAIIVSPMSAATAGMLGILGGAGVTPLKLLSITLPAFFIALICGCFSVYKRGQELEHDPEFKRRVAAGEYESLHHTDTKDNKLTPNAKSGLIIFALGIAGVIFLGSVTSLLPSWDVNGVMQRLSTPMLIQMLMLATACFIILNGKLPADKLAAGSVFRAGLIGVVGVFGVGWMTGTFFDAYKPEFISLFSGMVQTAPLLFGIVLFCFSAVIFSPSVTVASLMPLGLSLGIPPEILIALYPATCGDFIVPGANQISCVSFDRTGTTKIGKFVVNHSYMRPGFVMIITGVAAGYFIVKILY
ncbi:anaerobic C4-dicarboxylate transporter family protein [Anaerosinus massiliensis]|uniref:anaerobic C4-dicarboxylate transporter family protein n=1 Tax=Massilibacillus massiliensis TaxID=1806837 RepID=UPI000DA6273A|nr:anaerobic C4-dicarboxylate transporter family protein [Massilibacillus massiliensis]